MSRYYRENPDEPIQHDWYKGGRRAGKLGSFAAPKGSATEGGERVAERKPDTATGTVQTAEKPLPDFSDLPEREARYRKAHGLSEDAIIFTDELYTREELIERGVAELKRAMSQND